jgi:hypothetical protein
MVPEWIDHLNRDMLRFGARRSEHGESTGWVWRSEDGLVFAVLAEPEEVVVGVTRGHTGPTVFSAVLPLPATWSAMSAVLLAGVHVLEQTA